MLRNTTKLSVGYLVYKRGINDIFSGINSDRFMREEAPVLTDQVAVEMWFAYLWHYFKKKKKIVWIQYT